MDNRLRDRALKLLARREHSRAELRQKLLDLADEPQSLDSLLDEFEQRGWLSDHRFVEQVLQRRQGRFGVRRIAQELRQKGVPETLVDEAEKAAGKGERDAARAVWRRKFGKLPDNAAERAKQYRFLMNRGFSPEIVSEILKHDDE